MRKGDIAFSSFIGSNAAVRANSACVDAEFKAQPSFERFSIKERHLNRAIEPPIEHAKRKSETL